MESERTYRYTTMPTATSHTRPHEPHAVALALDPPNSRTVLERLSDCLTLPHSIAMQQGAGVTRSGPYRGAAQPYTIDRSKRPAYEACAQVIRHHSRSFYLSALLLPSHKRHGVMALYAFCRLSDDLVDAAGGADARDGEAIARVKALLALNTWARANASLAPDTDHPVVLAWADARNRFGIPQTLADELIDGVRMDLTIRRYDTWDDLWLYCYHVASTVGLMSMYITGAQTMDAVPYAVQLGVALQLTNILRDVGEDARAGRIYLPAEDMERFGYTEEMLMSGVVNDRFRRLMDFEIARARALYDAARVGIAMLHPDSRLAVSAASTLYRGILDKIEDAGHAVFDHRAHLSGWERLRALPGLWLETRC